MTSISIALDSKVVQKPAKFKGPESEWLSWSFVFTNFLAALDEDILRYLTVAEQFSTPLEMASLGAQAKKISSMLYSLLAQVLEGPPLRILMATRDRNGLEAWRKLKLRYEPSMGHRTLGALQAIMNFGFG